uniref:Ig-like domain-containing protein n=1 Tax=Amphimedon queenslandica TaxID=400682 RepID=A0A1X7SLF4_AMPQE
PTSSISLVHSPKESYYKANNSVILSCKVTEPDLTLVDVETTAMVMWDSSKNIFQQYFIHSYNEYFNHTLTNIKLSDAGEYNCTYYLNSTTDNPYIIPSDVRTGVTNVTIKIPSFVSPSITQLNSFYIVGDNISLICSVTYSHSPLIDIATNVNIQWLNSSNHTLHSYTGINNNTEHTISYTINDVSLSDAGQYACQYNISSTNHSFVLPSDDMRNSTIVFIKIPNDKVPVINLIPHQSVYDAGSDITLSCSVTYPYSSYIDADTNLTLQWFSSSNHTLNSSTIINDNNGHTLTYTISNARLSDAGLYTCSFFINTSIPHIVTSDATIHFIIINIK